MKLKLPPRWHPLRLAGLALLLIFPSTITAQSQHSARRDQAAVLAVNQALSAMGGTAVWSQLSDAEVTGICTAPEAQGGASANFLWTTQGQEFRYETDTANSGPVYLSAHGKPYATAPAGNVTLAPEYSDRMLPFHLPGLPLRVALADETISIFLVGQETENGISATHVRLTQVISNAKVRGSDQDWWFDPTTGLPLRVGYLIPTQTEHLYAHLLWNFGGWSQEGSLTLPHQLAQSLNGEMTLQVCNVLGIKTNSGPAAAIFDAR